MVVDERLPSDSLYRLLPYGRTQHNTGRPNAAAYDSDRILMKRTVLSTVGWITGLGPVRLHCPS